MISEQTINKNNALPCLLRWSYPQFFPLSNDKEIVEYAAGHKHGGHETGHNADAECDGEAPDRPCPELKQNQSNDKSRHVGIKNGHQRLAETPFDSRPWRFPQPQLFTNSFKDEDVGIDRHAYGEDDTGNTGQCQSRSKKGKSGHNKEDVEKKRHVRHQSRQAIV